MRQTDVIVYSYIIVGDRPTIRLFLEKDGAAEAAPACPASDGHGDLNLCIEYTNYCIGDNINCVLSYIFEGNVKEVLLYDIVVILGISYIGG